LHLAIELLISIRLIFQLTTWQELGDLGLVAKMSRSSQGRMISYFGNSQKKKSQNLTITKVLDTFRTIAKVRLLLVVLFIGWDFTYYTALSCFFSHFVFLGA
jgi:hypothetical protein